MGIFAGTVGTMLFFKMTNSYRGKSDEEIESKKKESASEITEQSTVSNDESQNNKTNKEEKVTQTTENKRIVSVI